MMSRQRLASDIGYQIAVRLHYILSRVDNIIKQASATGTIAKCICSAMAIQLNEVTLIALIVESLFFGMSPQRVLYDLLLR